MVAEGQSSNSGAAGGGSSGVVEGAPSKERRRSFMPSKEQMTAMRERATSSFDSMRGRKKNSAVLRDFYDKTGGMS